jgi:hypothetical protein
MCGFSRLLLILILVLALPVRGYAASVMMLCGPSGQSHTVGTMDTSSHGHHTGHEAPASDACDQHGVSDVAAEPTAHDHQSSTCSVCGVCCAGLLSSKDIATSPHGVVSSGPIAFFDRHFAGFIPATLERPPLPFVR